MGFSNGYDSGYSDAIEDVRNGKVAGIGPASGDGGALEGYDVGKLLSADEDEVVDYVTSLSDGQLKKLVSNTSSYLNPNIEIVRNNLRSEGDNCAGLARILRTVLNELDTRHLITHADE